ncbi:MAG TPA: hypothetical protein VFP50_15475 [Anaeromyxobacteraceae bacterium]|nr:hypothetical protein [Anaeromyxobacteraceae bacterium]
MSTRARFRPWFAPTEEQRMEAARVAAGLNRGNVVDMLGGAGRIEPRPTNADPVWVTLTLHRLDAVQRWRDRWLRELSEP